MCLFNLGKCFHKKTAANFDINIPLLDGDSLFHSAIFGIEYQA
jgi:hypothetical protein